MGNKHLLFIGILILGGLLLFGWLVLWPVQDDDVLAKPLSIAENSREEFRILHDTIADFKPAENESNFDDTSSESIKQEHATPLKPTYVPLEIKVIDKYSEKPMKNVQVILESNTEIKTQKDDFYDALEDQGWGKKIKDGEDNYTFIFGDKSYTNSTGITSVQLPRYINYNVRVVYEGYYDKNLEGYCLSRPWGEKWVIHLVPIIFNYQPVELRRDDWELVGKPVNIFGKVIDQAGLPVADAKVKVIDLQDYDIDDELENRIINETVYMDSSRGDGKTDPMGAFIIQNIWPGLYKIGVIASDSTDKATDVSLSGVIVRIPEGVHEQYVTVKVYRGLWIEGNVASYSGAPLDQKNVLAFNESKILANEKTRYISWLSTESDKTGRFRIGPLFPGIYSLQAQGGPRNPYLDSEILYAEAGDKGVVLYLILGGILRGRIAGYEELDADRVKISIYQDDSICMVCTSDADGKFRWEGLQPGLYDLRAQAGNTWIGFYFDASIVSGNETEELVIRLDNTAIVNLQLEGGEDTYWYRIKYQGHTIEDWYIYPNDPMTIPVPPGLLKLVLYEIIEVDEESVDLEEVAFEEFNINSGEEKNVVFKLKE